MVMNQINERKHEEMKCDRDSKISKQIDHEVSSSSSSGTSDGKSTIEIFSRKKGKSMKREKGRHKKSKTKRLQSEQVKKSVPIIIELIQSQSEADNSIEDGSASEDMNKYLTKD